MGLSQAVQSIVAATREHYADVELSAEDAKTMFAGKRSVKVSELSDHSIMQLVIIQQSDFIRELKSTIELQRMTIERLPKGNRQTRRHRQ